MYSVHSIFDSQVKELISDEVFQGNIVPIGNSRRPRKSRDLKSPSKTLPRRTYKKDASRSLIAVAKSRREVSGLDTTAFTSKEEDISSAEVLLSASAAYDKQVATSRKRPLDHVHDKHQESSDTDSDSDDQGLNRKLRADATTSKTTGIVPMNLLELQGFPSRHWSGSFEC